jgi:hypothetical protein
MQRACGWLLLLIAAPVIEGGGGAAGLPAPNLILNYNCTDVPFFNKCCQEFTHPGTCFKINGTDAHPEKTCSNYCLMKGGLHGRRLGSSKGPECTKVEDHHRRLGSESLSAGTACKKSTGEAHGRRLGESQSSFCPVESMYYLDECYDTTYLHDTTYLQEHYKEYLEKSPEDGIFFDYNPVSRVCCIPVKDEPIVPSFNRYTINRPAALKQFERRLGGSGGGAARQDWVPAVKKEQDEKHNICAQPEVPHGLFGMGGHLEYLPVFSMFTIIMVFTIFCEQCLAKSRSWVEYFNPLLKPCIDKVTAELMILGATAFSILIYNESTHNSLANGTVMPKTW